MIAVTPRGLARRMVNWNPVPGRPDGIPRCLVISGSFAIQAPPSFCGFELVLGPKIEVRGVMALVQLLGQFAERPC
jgi:hypothetical protein